MTSDEKNTENEDAAGFSALPKIDQNATAFSHHTEDGFSLFLANRTKTIHFIRHAEGQHNEANAAYGDDTPVTYSTPGAWKYTDAYLTQHGIQQCVTARETLIDGMRVHPQLIVVSPFTRTLQTAHIMFSGKRIPFLVHDLCQERSGKYTCDKRRSKKEIIDEFGPIYDTTQDAIDFESFG
jgi:broad specificity phosphatase PhoE